MATVFSRTNSLAIKVRGLQSFVILCGGSNEAANDDGLSGLLQENKKTSSSTALDKYTMQEKIVPLIKAIKTKEPAVMIAALNVLRIVGQVADADFVAMEILPVLWSMSLGPLLDLKQFQTFMELIKNLSTRVEDEQTRKLQELSGSGNATTAAANEDFLAFGGVTGTAFEGTNGTSVDDFEALVKGKGGGGGGGVAASGSGGFPSWDDPAPANVTSPTTNVRSQPSTPQTPAFSWSTQPTSPPTQQPSFRTVTPDLGQFKPMAPSSTQFSQPLQPTSNQGSSSMHHSTSSMSSVNWSTASTATQNPWASSTPTASAPNYSSSSMGGMNSTTSAMGNMSMGGRPSMSGHSTSSRGSSFSLAPPPGSNSQASSISMKPPSQTSWNNAGAVNSNSMGGMMAARNNSMGGVNSMNSMGMNTGGMNNDTNAHANTNTNTNAGQQSRSGLDKYQSLI